MESTTIYLEQTINNTSFGYDEAEQALTNAGLPWSYILHIDYVDEEAEVFYYFEDIQHSIIFKEA